MFLNTDFEIYGSSHADDGGGDGDCDDVFDDGGGDDDDGNDDDDDDDDADIDDDHGDDDRRLGVENGAERRPPPGIQAQRPAPAHRTHDTTDQWREIFLRLGRSAAYFPSHPRSPKNTSRVPSIMSFILVRFYNGFLVDQAWPVSKNKGFVNSSSF